MSKLEREFPKDYVQYIDYTDTPGWYFEDETQCFDGNGPYDTKEEAMKAAQAYADSL